MRKTLAVVSACLGLALLLVLPGCAQVNEGLDFLNSAAAEVREKGYEAAATFVDTRCSAKATDLDARAADLEAINKITEKGDWLDGFDCDGDGKADVHVNPPDTVDPDEPKEVSYLGSGIAIDHGRRGGGGGVAHRYRQYYHGPASVPDEQPVLERRNARVELARIERRKEPERGRRLTG